LILNAQKAGAWFDKIVIKNTTFTEVCLPIPSELQSDIPSLYVHSNVKSDSLWLALYALRRGLQLQWLHIVEHSDKHLELFLEALPKGLKIKGLKIVSYNLGSPVRSLFNKLKKGAALQHLESMDLTSYNGINTKTVKFIAASIRAGVELKSLHLSSNMIGSLGTELITKAIEESQITELILHLEE